MRRVLSYLRLSAPWMPIVRAGVSFGFVFDDVFRKLPQLLLRLLNLYLIQLNRLTFCALQFKIAAFFLLLLQVGELVKKFGSLDFRHAQNRQR